VKTLGDAVVGGDFKVVLVGDDAQVGHPPQGFKRLGLVGDENIVFGMAEGHGDAEQAQTRRRCNGPEKERALAQPPGPGVVDCGMSTASLAGLLPAYLMPEPEWTEPPAAASPVEAELSAFANDEENVRLMCRVRDGDMRAFERLVELHQNTVIGTAARMLGNLDDAHDIAQQVFLRVWKSAPRYEPTAKFTTWLFTILRNLHVGSHRAAARRGVAVAFDEADLPGVAAAQDTTVEANDVLGAVGQLPEDQKSLLLLVGVEDLSYDDAAKVMGVPIGTVMSRLSRGRQRLRALLETGRTTLLRRVK